MQHQKQWVIEIQIDEEERMRTNVVCKCEKVTELKVVRAMRRRLPINSTQAIRKRTRAGIFDFITPHRHWPIIQC
jgi:NAD(P)H-nitrite reductase large subunit